MFGYRAVRIISAFFILWRVISVWTEEAFEFVDKDIGDVKPVKPTSLEETPFKLVEEVKDLKELAAKLRSVNEFAVDQSTHCRYQNADWRLRPLPDEMLRYAREDTHYSLYIYDMMKIKLFSMSKESVSSDASLIDVYKRGYNTCMQLYEKELLKEHSYLHVYGLVPYYLSLR
ncbi:hypothetical protein Pint_20013 [Pistacia integerrima]|uniref:Uncharacterized protein n=1 Tax=Pistacia integerrima TaxID=434235 RepID=A0ACC0X891_9ROSI|nr:hypothetical protein Pint_20013 [Pistacia integerrima]